MKYIVTLLLLYISVLVSSDSSSEEDLLTSKTTCNCGWTNRGRLVGGNETGKHEYPWMASISTLNGSHQCGASIITPYHAVTAAHCVYFIQDDAPSYRLVVGGHDTRELAKGTDGIMMEILKMISLYNFPQLPDDIGMVVTKDPIKFTQLVGPICLPLHRVDIENKKVTAIGWGQSNVHEPMSSVLKSEELTGISHKSCQKYWENKVPMETITDIQKQLCTSDEGKATCHGDSGGPLTSLDPKINRYTLLGITSFGDPLCITPTASVFTEVYAYMPWIEQIIKENSPAPVRICTATKAF